MNNAYVVQRRSTCAFVDISIYFYLCIKYD